MEQPLSVIEKAYDAVAKEYAAFFAGEHGKKPKDQEVLLRFSREVAGKTPVWDAGCGPGHTAKYLYGLGVDISGLDLSEQILEQAKANYPAIGFRKGNILDLDFEDDSVAGIVSFYSIVHFTKDQVKSAFQELFRVLQPQGLLLITFHIGDETIPIEEFLGKRMSVDFMLFTTEFITGCLKKIGFESIEIIEREPYPGIEYQSRRAYVFARKIL